MNIIVPIKQVPESEEMRLDPATRTLVRQGVTMVVNPFDKRALTEAIHLRSQYGGSVTAITMGPPQAKDALVECLGLGVDRAVLISDRAFAGSDTLATSRTLAASIKSIPFDIILCGKWSTDSETGQVGPEVAALLGLPQVTGATALELDEDSTLHVTRETDYGFETVACPMPALLTASERLIRPIKTTSQVIETGQQRLDEDPALIQVLTLAGVGLPADQVGIAGSPTEVEALRPVEMQRSHVTLSGDPEIAAAQLLEALKARGLDAGHHTSREPVLPLAPTAEHPDPAGAVWAVAEWSPSEGGEVDALRHISLELMGHAAALAYAKGGPAVGVLLGHNVGRFVPDLAHYGASSVLLADAPELGGSAPESCAWVLSRAIEQYKPWAVLLPATTFGRDVAPRVAAQLGLGLTGDCLGLEIDEQGRLLQLKPAFGGQVVAPITSKTAPAMATVRPGMLPRYKPDESRSAQMIRLDTAGVPVSPVRVLSITHEGEQGLALDSARLVVSVGMGTGGPEALDEVRRLAEALGGWMGLDPDEIAIGGSRKVVDSGWLPRQQQIGITGRAVAPDLYLALGVSGKFNHMVGILGARTVVAVNSDPDAPMMQGSDYCVVTDWKSFADAVLRLLGAGSGG